MGNFKSQKELIAAIAANIDQLESGKLTLSELENHMNNVRDLYERTLIIRYKIFEEKSETPVVDIKVEVISEPISSIPEIEEPIITPELSDDKPVIDFSLFDSPVEEEEEELPKSTLVVEEKVTEVVQEIKEEPKAVEESQAVAPNSNAFNRRFSDIISQTAGQFGFSKLDTLVGSFGLNERLQYINELFDGSSEVFAEAIKSLDSMPSLDSAKSKTAQLADQNNWDLESDTVEEFIQKLCRRYA